MSDDDPKKPPGKPMKVSEFLNHMINAGIGHWAAEQGMRLGARHAGKVQHIADQVIRLNRSESKPGDPGVDLEELVAPGPTVRYKFWQVGWEDEAFEFDLPQSVISNDECPACHVNSLPDVPGLEGCISFFAFHPTDAPEKVEARCMEVILNPLHAFFGPRYGFACHTVSLEEAQRRQPDENPRDNN